MGDIEVFKIDGQEVSELPGTSVAVGKSLSALAGRCCEALLAIRFLSSEHYSAGKRGDRASAGLSRGTIA